MSISRRMAGLRAVVYLLVLSGTHLSAQYVSRQQLGSYSAFPPPEFQIFDRWSSPSMTTSKQSLISADFLRHPLTGKAERALMRAQKMGSRGDHRGAIAELRDLLAKFPKAAPYTHNLLGVEYVEVCEYAAARDEFARVLDAMPHLSANHSNYGLTLVALGDARTAEHELRLALALDGANEKAKAILKALERK
jgi:Flp pilus assembly protein TadD